MRSGIKAVGNENSVSEVVLDWFISFRYFDELLLNWANNWECYFDLFFRLVSLNSCADDSDVGASLTHTMH